MSTISGLGSSSGEIRTDYLNLLVAQLRNQNPLDPMDNSEMASQLAQLSQLEQLENISSTFQKVFLGTQLSQARELIGKVVSFVPEGADQEYWGKVDRVDIVNGDVRLWVGTYPLGLDEIRTIFGDGFATDVLPDQLAQAAELIGREVTFSVTGEDGLTTEVTGLVDGVVISDGRVCLKVGDRTVELVDIQAIAN